MYYMTQKDISGVNPEVRNFIEAIKELVFDATNNDRRVDNLRKIYDLADAFEIKYLVKNEK